MVATARKPHRNSAYLTVRCIEESNNMDWTRVDGMATRRYHHACGNLIICVVVSCMLMACSVSYKFNGASIDYTKTKTIQIVDFPIRSSYLGVLRHIGISCQFIIQRMHLSLISHANILLLRLVKLFSEAVQIPP